MSRILRVCTVRQFESNASLVLLWHNVTSFACNPVSVHPVFNIRKRGLRASERHGPILLHSEVKGGGI